MTAVAAYYSGLKPTKGLGSLPAPIQPTPISWTTAPGGMAVAKQIFNDRCVRCHVNGGRGDLEGNYPDLTLQATPYVAQTLYAFRTRARPNTEMVEIIDSLTFDEMTNLAYFVNGLAPQRALRRVDMQAASRGAVIATRGIPARGVPACMNCHSAQGVTALPLIPRLQGQNVAYLHTRLDRFADPNLTVSALNPMPLIASQMTNKERADAAAYFAAAAPLPKPAARP
jgi:cytochrome c553